MEAIEFVMRTNKRRNLTSSQWAGIAVISGELVERIRAKIEKVRREKQAESLESIERDEKGKFTVSDNLLSQTDTAEPDLFSGPMVKKPSGKSKGKAGPKKDKTLAGMFHTNPTYINEAARFQKENPEVFGQIVSGEVTITKVIKMRKQVYSPLPRNLYFQ